MWGRGKDAVWHFMCWCYKCSLVPYTNINRLQLIRMFGCWTLAATSGWTLEIYSHCLPFKSLTSRFLDTWMRFLGQSKWLQKEIPCSLRALWGYGTNSALGIPVEANTVIAKRELYVSLGGDAENAKHNNEETQNKSSLKTIVPHLFCVNEKNLHWFQ